MKTEITALYKCSDLHKEEWIRRSLIRRMVREWGFPRGLISVERAIGPRRYDLVCYSQEMVPLLLVECKVGPLNAAAIRQVFGYNEVLKAPFICLANAKEILTLWHERGKIVSVPFLPVFKELYDVSRRF